MQLAWTPFLDTRREKGSGDSEIWAVENCKIVWKYSHFSTTSLLSTLSFDYHLLVHICHATHRVFGAEMTVYRKKDGMEKVVFSCSWMLFGDKWHYKSATNDQTSNTRTEQEDRDLFLASTSKNGTPMYLWYVEICIIKWRYLSPKRLCSWQAEEACYCQNRGQNLGPPVTSVTWWVSRRSGVVHWVTRPCLFLPFPWGILTLRRKCCLTHECTGMTFTLYMYETLPSVMTNQSSHLAALVSDRQVVSVVDDRWSVVTAQTWTCTTWHRSCICSMSIGHTIPSLERGCAS